MGLGKKQFSAIVSVLAWACMCQGQEITKEGPHFKEDFEQGLASIWKEVEFTGKTVHAIVAEGTNHVMRAHAASAASGLAIDKRFSMNPRMSIRWRWKIDRIPAGGTDSDIKTFDHTARLFVAFKSLIGPPYTVNYVWANDVPVGKTYHHPRSGRARFIVLQSGNEKAHQWMLEERSLHDDWKKLFGEEPPPIVGLGFMTDSDGTKQTVTGWYDDITLFEQEKRVP